MPTVTRMISGAFPPPDSGPKKTEVFRRWLAAVALGLLGLVAYANSFRVPLLLDDLVAIQDNPTIRSLRDPAAVLLPSGAVTTAGRPLLNLSLALNYAVGGAEVRGYHAVNLAIHLAAGLVLFGLVRRSLLLPGLRERWGATATGFAAATAAVWLVHPLHTSAVTYLSQRAESLAGLLYLLTLYGFVRAAGAEAARGWLAVSVGSCWLALATKEIAVTAPVAVLLFDRALASASWGEALRRRAGYYGALAGGWVLLAALMVHSRLGARGVGFDQGLGVLAYAQTELVVVCRYLGLALWPHPLVFDYGPELRYSAATAVLPALALVAAAGGFAVRQWRQARPAGLVAAMFFLLLAPTSTVVPIAGQPMAESRMYLPLAAVTVLLAGWAWHRAGKWRGVAVGLLVVGLAGLTHLRNRDYRSALSIWEDTIAKQPQSSRGQYNLSLELAKIPGREGEAVERVRQSLKLNPGDPQAHYHLGRLTLKQPGQAAAAAGHFAEAVRLRPTYADAHLELGNALAAVPGRLEQALASYRRAIELKPEGAEAYSNLGTELVRLPGRTREAIGYFERAVALRPGFAEGRYNLGVAYFLSGNAAGAVRELEAALRLNPNLPNARRVLERARAQGGG